MTLSEEELQLLLDFVHDVFGGIRIIEEVFADRD